MSATTTFTQRGITSHQDVLAKVCGFSLHSILAKHKRRLSVFREQQLAQGHGSSSTARLNPAGGSSLATLSQLSKTSNNSNTVGANSRADRWHRLRSTSYHMHDCCLPQPSSVTDHLVTGTTGTGTGAGVNGTAYGCGVMFTEAESQSLNQLLVATVDVLVDSGTPNVGIIDCCFFGLLFAELFSLCFSALTDDRYRRFGGCFHDALFEENGQKQQQ